jgi:hypothetical protein
MKGIVRRLREVNENSLIMKVVKDCMDAAEEIERLGEESALQKQTIREIKKTLAKKNKTAKK